MVYLAGHVGWILPTVEPHQEQWIRKRERSSGVFTDSAGITSSDYLLALITHIN